MDKTEAANIKMLNFISSIDWATYNHPIIFPKNVRLWYQTGMGWVLEKDGGNYRTENTSFLYDELCLDADEDVIHTMLEVRLERVYRECRIMIDKIGKFLPVDELDERWEEFCGRNSDVRKH